MADDILNGSVDGGTPAPVGEPTAAPTVEIPEFLKGLNVDDEIKTSKILQDHKSIDDVVKSYYHAKKLVGADKMVIPGEKASDEEWGAVFKKLGLPESVDKYGVDRKADSPVDEKFFAEFKQRAHAAGILPKQAAKLMGFFEEQAKNAGTIQAQQIELQTKKELEELQTEWGGSFKGNVNRANFALKKYGGDEFVAYLGERGLGSSPQMIKFLANVGQALGEDNILGEATTQNTPAQALARINAIKADKSHGYWTGDKAALMEMESLAKEAYGAE